ncbi:hypothetical protein GARC_1981 [Paraglaciecola arctica BSs20135]|uniref:Uncharacterized protein n=1 Tax=Paraglaciecola arctica BSs20135 TaxID=493475 RepID=K6YQP1_9ALTE|nr:hypothetical protein GARC_1981 [Paraglaciecola arctica BSs20135]
MCWDRGLSLGSQSKNCIGAMIFTKVTQGNLWFIHYNAFSIVMDKLLVII